MDILTTTANGILTLEFNRPERKNAITGAMYATMADALLDRLVHNAHKIRLKGESMRKLKNATDLECQPIPREIENPGTAKTDTKY